MFYSGNIDSFKTQNRINQWQATLIPIKKWIFLKQSGTVMKPIQIMKSVYKTSAPVRTSLEL